MRALAITNLLLATAALGFLGWQWREGRGLQAELDPLRDSVTRERARLATEKARLAAGQPEAADLARLRADHAMLADLRAELAALNSRTEARLKAPVLSVPQAISPPADAPLRAANQWQNVGHAEPASLLETVAWAARNKNVDMLSSALTIEYEGARALVDLFNALPAAERQRYGSSDRIIAQEMAEEFALAAYREISRDAPGASAQSTGITARLYQADGRERDVSFNFHRVGSDGWRLFVPRDAALHYVERLKHRLAGGGTR